MPDKPSDLEHFYLKYDKNALKNIPSCFYRISVKGLILNEKKEFLLTKQKNDRWDLPGGGLDFGEAHSEGLAREIQEEMGLETTFIAQNPSYFITTPNQDMTWFANVIYLCKVKDLNFKSSWECQEIRFFNIEEAKKVDIISNVEEFIKLYDPSKH